MSDFGRRLRQVRQEMKMSQEEFAALLGTSKQVISRYENGQRSPKISVAADYAQKLGIPLGALNDDESPASPALPANVVPMAQMPRHRVRMIGSVAAGVPILAEEEYDIYIDAPEKADYALRVEGDSMQPNYLSGDVIYIKEQPDVDDGRVAVVLVDDSATLKHVYHEKDGLTLVSDNHDYPPMRMSFDEHEVIRIPGVVVGYTRMYRKKEKLEGVTKGMPVR